MRLLSWNVNGLRACFRKGGIDDILEYNPDIICLQEIKMFSHDATFSFPGYYAVWNSAVRAGYSGTLILSKEKPQKTWVSLLGKDDNEGRTILAEFDSYCLITVYTPNSKRDLSRSGYREEWDARFMNLVSEIKKVKPVIICGDFNVCNEPIDLARPSANEGNAGYTDKERKGFKNLLSTGLIDTFRMTHPQQKKYSWWSYFGNARANNTGWRLDYFLVSEDLKDKVVDSDCLTDVFGSDHCPILLDLEV